MDDIKKCLSVFAVATWSSNIRSLVMADAAINAYLEPHVAAGTIRPALQTLLKAFGNMREDSVVGYAIRTDLKNRLSRLSEAAAFRGAESAGAHPHPNAAE